MARITPRASFWAWSAVAGVVSAAVFLAVAEILSLVFARDGSPILAVGGFVIDIVPQPFKEFAIETFAEYDKIALLVGLGLAVVIASALAGIVQFARPPLGLVAFTVAGVLSGAAVLTRAGATFISVIPTVTATVSACVIVRLLVARLWTWAHSTTRENSQAGGVDRRAFVRLTALAGLSAVIVGAGARVATVATSSIEAVRKALTLPTPTTTVTIPEGAQLDVPGLSPLITSNADFYRVDTALTVPSIDPETWKLTIDGMVGERIELSFDDLVAMGVDEYAITLTCVSNEVGGDLLGNAIWLGIPLRKVLERAAPASDADMVLSRSVDGYTASTPLSALVDDDLDAILAIGMNGEPLPLEHGFPVRMVVPGLYGYVSATKWLTQLTVTTFAQDEAYWTPRGYSAQAPIKFSSRIDTPRPGTPINAGRVPVAGMAWAQTVGIDRVEVRIDDGDWQPATLSTPINKNTWVQWFIEWDATPGTHYLTVRAVNVNGDVQTEERAPIAPDGSSGWQRTLVTVTDAN
ncbi:molybdopterin-dependent oxidoreductase [Microbacterium sp. C7(2022)]|uniref:molybdopterin-dependent oxidoreductase n=1 Tax=Microbacterium sp. C7(2022) TaxID=2992759 RepID=UPI00237C3FEE|nr:molybdopterin-dependent oxidoreductase [Microbacterium sp. C7(2022)]MDE0545638.1 molybdopterin-dependent oxidoreductase [Microbacterium sp. C7(2022)]